MSFKGLNLTEKMLSSLSRQGFTNPSDIQLRSIPKALRGESLMVQSATGTGKTLCFLIPTIQNIDLNNQNVQAIIVAPTKELANQIFDFATPFLKEYSNLKIKIFRSGEERERTSKGLSIPPHIIIGTPGRLADMIKQNNINLSFVKTVVFDEADMLLREGYFEQIDQFTTQLNNPQYLVFSATLEKNLSYKLSKYVGENTPIENEDVMTSNNVKHYLVDIKHQDKIDCVKHFIKAKNPYLLLVFASTKEVANQVYSSLRDAKYKVGLLTGDLSSRERKNIIKMIENDKIYILVCSDLASRGLDVDNVTDVLNVDLPNNLEFYYHRAGRTGRFNKTGNCYTFYNNDSTNKPLSLIEHGINFEYLVLKDNELVEGKPIEKKKLQPKRIDEELDKQIKMIKAKNVGKNKKVKPGYKAKTKQEIAKAKQKHRREIIKKDIRRQRIERYKKASKLYE